MVLIEVNGGVLQSVSSDNPEMLKLLEQENVVLVDYDIEGATEDELSPIDFTDGSYGTEAYCRELAIDRTIIDCEKLKKEIEKWQ